LIYKVKNSTIEFVLGDITEQRVDAVVNAANAALSEGGGVDRAIHKRGGPRILQDTRRRYPMGCQTGSAVASVPGDLPCRVVIHAVGPVWHEGTAHEPELLRRAYESSLEVAQEHECESIAFPAISCGAFAFPLDQGADIAISTIKHWIEEHDCPKLVKFVLFAESTHSAFLGAAARLLSPSPQNR
jgi:O-acetyl-ADP-ribose deacetylase (regulator of RNase III)